MKTFCYVVNTVLPLGVATANCLPVFIFPLVIRAPVLFPMLVAKHLSKEVTFRASRHCMGPSSGQWDESRVVSKGWASASANTVVPCPAFRLVCKHDDEASAAFLDQEITWRTECAGREQQRRNTRNLGSDFWGQPFVIFRQPWENCPKFCGWLLRFQGSG